MFTREDVESPVPCPDHPDSDLVEWGRTELTAYRYVVAYAREVRLDASLDEHAVGEMVLQFPDLVAAEREQGVDRWTGVSEVDLLVAALLWLRWGDVLPEDVERAELPPGGPGLYGSKASSAEVEAYQARVRALRDERKALRA
jgi:hypothetical protein